MSKLWSTTQCCLQFVQGSLKTISSHFTPPATLIHKHNSIQISEISLTSKPSVFLLPYLHTSLTIKKINFLFSPAGLLLITEDIVILCRLLHDVTSFTDCLITSTILLISKLSMVHLYNTCSQLLSRCQHMYITCPFNVCLFPLPNFNLNTKSTFEVMSMMLHSCLVCAPHKTLQNRGSSLL